MRPRPAADDDEDVPLAKKLKAEPAPAAKKPLEPAAVKSEPGSKPPSGSGTSTKPAAKTGEAAKLEITKEAVIAVLKTSGKILSGELINKFKLTHKLKVQACCLAGWGTQRSHVLCSPPCCVGMYRRRRIKRSSTTLSRLWQSWRRIHQGRSGALLCFASSTSRNEHNCP